LICGVEHRPHLNAGLTRVATDKTMHPLPNAWMNRMDTPPPNRPVPLTATDPSAAQMLAWLRLRQEMLELHARLEYVKLMLKIGG
jgi:hypothetical protein